ncbi:helix-turn-helix transcriptional regulator [Sporomusa sp.]|uniref:helix-turn-helix transcriptional regulator n=1 Tax=Sporomusa sp. TaxID=2078658 RepID=UPI002BFE84D5|nr:helix-turn-helix transcriptional regulator [Sporomusa sp.]HWR45066.1 helix-turn-helix transcriptional regulator [Sporomusa sp.]
MTETISYTPDEVSKILKISRFTVYEMIKRGDLAAYRIGRKVRVEAPDLDVYIKNSKGNSLAASISEARPAEAASPVDDSIILCGQDVILDILARHLGKEMPHVRFLRNYVGSVDGLLALYRGTVNAVTAHLWDSDTDTYNLPYVRRFLPGHHTLIVNLAYRIEGFYVHKGNPKNLMTWEDLSRPSVRLVNREPGAGARVLLDEKLRMLNINHKSIIGYDHEQMSHLAVASAVARDQADVGVGIEKVAQQVSGIDFIPLQKERYDLIIRREDSEKPQFQALLSILRSQTFRNEVQGLGGYDLKHTGNILGET